MSNSRNGGALRLILVAAGLGGFLYGIDFGVIAAATPYIRALGLFSDAAMSHVVGAVLLGGIVSSLTAGWLAEHFGRKVMIVVAAWLFLLAMPAVCLSDGNFGFMIAGRFLQGMSAGYMSVVMPMYLTEILPADIRGRGTGVFQFSLALGLTAAAAFGFAISCFWGNQPSFAWKANFWWTMLPVAVLAVVAIFLPESPAMTRHGGRADTPQYFNAEAMSTSSLFQRRYVIPFLLAVLVLTFNKTTGMSSITSYSVTIFHKAGFSGTLGNVGDFAIKITNLLVTMLAASLVDRRGRRFLLKIGTAGMTLGMTAIGLVFWLIERGTFAASSFTGGLCLAAFFLMQVFYSLGPGICVWLVLSELMPQRIRANGMAIALFMNQFVAWGLAASFLPWVNHWGWHTMFFFFALNGLLYFVTVLFIPETKGKSLDELEHLFG